MKSEETPFRSLSRAERRERILWAAKEVMMEKGVDEASMDDVAACAGTTKPTVYAHFKSKDELFAAVADLIKGLFLGKLGNPEVYSSDPVEAVALFCGRFVELTCWQAAIGYQRVALAAAVRSPMIAGTVYQTMFGGACTSLADYLRARKLTRTPDRDAEFVLAATSWVPMMRHLYGLDEPSPEMPGLQGIAGWVDMKKIREAVKLIATTWKLS